MFIRRTIYFPAFFNHMLFHLNRSCVQCYLPEIMQLRIFEMSSVSVKRHNEYGETESRINISNELMNDKSDF